ncbi:MAG: hypothetical protein K2J20_03240, partial [Bacilli bacterium]|nr:hypothetical protein [Bacilli bacterium]
KRPIIDEYKVQNFFITTGEKGYAANIEIYEGVIILVSVRDSRDEESVLLHDFRNCKPNWKEVAQTLINCRHNSNYSDILGMLDKNSEEYKALKKAMEECVGAEIFKLNEKIRKWESFLEKY